MKCYRGMDVCISSSSEYRIVKSDIMCCRGCILMMIGDGLKRNEMLSGNGCVHLVIVGVSYRQE
jgi:hypothetical protein